MHVWNTGYVEFEIVDDKVDPDVQVTTLHWTCTKDDGGDVGSSYGTTTAEIPVEPKSASEARSKIDWDALVQLSLGVEEVQRIEDSIDAQIVELKTPTSGGFTPS